MSSIITFSGLDADDAYRRTQDLADFLKLVAAGDQPSAADLAAAPVIDHWSMSIRPDPCLVGVISGHPTIGLMRPGATSGLYALDPDRWARTASRLYRLGRRAGDDGRVQ